MEISRRHALQSKRSGIWINVLFLSFSLFIVIPVLYVFSISVSDDTYMTLHGFSLIPGKLSLSAYRYIFHSPDDILTGYLVSTSVTVFGTFVSMFVTSAYAYAISRKDFRMRRFFTLFAFFTILFNGGLAPTYILITRYLHLKNNVLVLVLPYLISAWLVIIMKGFMSDIPASLVDSAKIDGANEVVAYFRIIIPISKPALATLALLISFQYWNDWWLAMLYIDKSHLVPLQLMLYRMMTDLEAVTNAISRGVTVDVKNLPGESARMAMCVLAAGPMLVVFPFFQKYFVKGIAVGALKE